MLAAHDMEMFNEPMLKAANDLFHCKDTFKMRLLVHCSVRKHFYRDYCFSSMFKDHKKANEEARNSIMGTTSTSCEEKLEEENSNNNSSIGGGGRRQDDKLLLAKLDALSPAISLPLNTRTKSQEVEEEEDSFEKSLETSVVPPSSDDSTASLLEAGTKAPLGTSVNI